MALKNEEYQQKQDEEVYFSAKNLNWLSTKLIMSFDSRHRWISLLLPGPNLMQPKSESLRVVLWHTF